LKDLFKKKDSSSSSSSSESDDKQEPVVEVPEAEELPVIEPEEIEP
jgi:hypothetical protein